jgi:hypothetical protein
MTDTDETWVPDRGADPEAARVILCGRAQHSTVARQLLLSQRGCHAPQCRLELVQTTDPPTLRVPPIHSSSTNWSIAGPVSM